jgi:molecular chaperone GrpE
VVDAPPEEEAAGEASAETAAPREESAAELESLRAERDDLRDRLLRKAAEFDNYRKRVERDRAQSAVEATAALLKTLIPTLDDLERALETDAGGSALRQGVELIQRDLLSALQSMGLVVEDPFGGKFDPSRQEALAHEPAAGFSEGDVVDVLRKGYSYRDRLLRPALVKVAKEGPASAKPTDKVH